MDFVTKSFVTCSPLFSVSRNTLSFVLPICLGCRDAWRNSLKGLRLRPSPLGPPRVARGTHSSGSTLKPLWFCSRILSRGVSSLDVFPSLRTSTRLRGSHKSFHDSSCAHSGPYIGESSQSLFSSTMSPYRSLLWRRVVGLTSLGFRSHLISPSKTES